MSRGSRPRTIRLEDGSTLKGYHLEQFRDAFSRYLGVSERHTDTTRMDTEVAAIYEPPHVAEAESRKPASANECGDLAADNAHATDDDRVLAELDYYRAALARPDEILAAFPDSQDRLGALPERVPERPFEGLFELLG